MLAVLSVVVVPAMRPSRIDGAAVAEPVPGPPNVGDCALDPVESMLSLLAGSPDQDYRYPSSNLQACEGPRYAEVVAVIPEPVEPTVTGARGAWSVDDPNTDSCYRSVATYIGTFDGAAAESVSWYPYLLVQASVSSPTPRQQADGQHWLACLAFAGGYGAETEPYDGTLREASTTGNQRDLIGHCSAGVDGNNAYSSGGCGDPHRYEMFAGAGTGEVGVDRSVLEASCADTLAEVTGLADVTAAGRLAVTVTASDMYGNPVEGPQLPASTTLSCGLLTVGNRQLDGSLLALGDEPLPWVA